MTGLTLALSDALELAELLRFLSEWTTRGDDRLSCSLADYIGHDAYGVHQLRDDLNRFQFLLGGNDEWRFLADPSI